MKTRDGTELFVKDWGTGEPMVFVHSWALTNDIWQYQHAHFLAQGRRVVAFDRRGHGRSAQPGDGYDMDRLADDLDEVLQDRGVTNATLIGHSMGCAEIIRYLARHGSARIARVVLAAPTTPFLLHTPDNPMGVPRARFEAQWSEWRKDFARWIRDNARPFFAPDTSNAIVDWGVTMMASQSLHPVLACSEAMVTSDLRADCARIDVPVLVIHGTADASAPIALTGKRTAELIPGARFQVYDGAPHGLMVTHVERVNADITAFCG
ncbi:MAG: alpha/beta hydrolase [Kofleriaceae bacterium]|nr:alpha/beta hydrolase [Kofleriaceae bacterium]